jgi:hypothetical protein
MAIHLGVQWLGQRDPYKEIEAQGRADAARMAAEDKIAREREAASAGAAPIDINSLSQQQVMLLLERIRAAKAARAGAAKDVTPAVSG